MNMLTDGMIESETFDRTVRRGTLDEFREAVREFWDLGLLHLYSASLPSRPLWRHKILDARIGELTDLADQAKGQVFRVNAEAVSGDGHNEALADCVGLCVEVCPERQDIPHHRYLTLDIPGEVSPTVLSLSRLRPVDPPRPPVLGDPEPIGRSLLGENYDRMQIVRHGRRTLALEAMAAIDNPRLLEILLVPYGRHSPLFGQWRREAVAARIAELNQTTSPPPKGQPANPSTKDHPMPPTQINNPQPSLRDNPQPVSECPSVGARYQIGLPAGAIDPRTGAAAKRKTLFEVEVVRLVGNRIGLLDRHDDTEYSPVFVVWQTDWAPLVAVYSPPLVAAGDQSGEQARPLNGPAAVLDWAQDEPGLWTATSMAYGDEDDGYVYAVRKKGNRYHLNETTHELVAARQPSELGPYPSVEAAQAACLRIEQENLQAAAIEAEASPPDATPDPVATSEPVNQLAPPGLTKQPPPAEMPACDEAMMPVDSLVVDPGENPRTTFDQGELFALGAHMSEVGQLQPLVAHMVDGHAHLLAGERRLRAARAAGDPLVRVRLYRRPLSARQSWLVRAENTTHVRLNPIERAREIVQGLDAGCSSEDVARVEACSVDLVQRARRMLDLPPEIQDLIAERKLFQHQANELCKDGLSDQQRLDLARRCAAEGWSEAAMRDAVNAIVNPPMPTLPGLSPGQNGDQGRPLNGQDAGEANVDDWRGVKIKELDGWGLLPRDVNDLALAGIHTLGDLEDRRTRDGEHWADDIQGVGETAVKRIEDAVVEFFARQAAAGKHDPITPAAPGGDRDELNDQINARRKAKADEAPIRGTRSETAAERHDQAKADSDAEQVRRERDTQAGGDTSTCPFIAIDRIGIGQTGQAAVHDGFVVLDNVTLAVVIGAQYEVMKGRVTIYLKAAEIRRLVDKAALAAKGRALVKTARKSEPPAAAKKPAKKAARKPKKK